MRKPGTGRRTVSDREAAANRHPSLSSSLLLNLNLSNPACYHRAKQRQTDRNTFAHVQGLRRHVIMMFGEAASFQICAARSSVKEAASSIDSFRFLLLMIYLFNLDIHFQSPPLGPILRALWMSIYSILSLHIAAFFLSLHRITCCHYSPIFLS